MRISGHWLRRQVAGCLVLLFAVPFVAATTSPQQEPKTGQPGGVSSAQAQSQDSDSGAKANAEPSQPETIPDSPGSVRSQTVDADPQSGGQQPSPKPQQNGTQEPVGTAAAQPVNTTGVAASKPAGAAIAPAKQRRARSMLIKVGVLVGACVAVGTVVALSSASPSRPPVSR